MVPETDPSELEPDIEIVFPLEFAIAGVPISHQASAFSQDAWKRRVSAAARARLQEGFWATLTAMPQWPALKAAGRLDLSDHERIEARIILGWHL